MKCIKSTSHWRKEYRLTRSSKPTQAQGLCGLTHCYVDARTGALEEKKKTRTEFEKREKDEKLKREDYDIESNH